MLSLRYVNDSEKYTKESIYNISHDIGHRFNLLKIAKGRNRMIEVKAFKKILYIPFPPPDMYLNEMCIINVPTYVLCAFDCERT